MLKENNNTGSCTLIEPDGKRTEFEVDEHDVPYVIVLMIIKRIQCPRLLLQVSPLPTLKRVKEGPGSQKMIGRDATGN